MITEYEADTSLPADESDHSGPSRDSRGLAAVAHLSSFVALTGIPSFIGPLVIWLLQKDRDRFVADEALEALNFNLSLLLYVAAAVVATIFTFGLGLIVVIPLALVAAPAWLVVTAVAASRAAEGKPYRYPATIRMIS